MTPGPGEGVLALFDIDGTLLRAGDAAHREAFDHALRVVYRVPATIDGVPLAGMLDRSIARLALADHGVGADAADAGLGQLVTVMGEHYVAAVPPGTRVDRLLPGVVASAHALHDAGVALAVVTGTVQPVARAKLAAAHLGDLFPIGAYGDEADDRADLVARGIAAAERFYGHAFEPRRAVVIGDTPLDVSAARRAGTRVVAVASGAATREALAEARPDHLLDDLSDVGAVLAAVVGRP